MVIRKISATSWQKCQKAAQLLKFTHNEHVAFIALLVQNGNQAKKLSSLISFSDMLTRPSSSQAEFVLECGYMVSSSSLRSWIQKMRQTNILLTLREFDQRGQCFVKPIYSQHQSSGDTDMDFRRHPCRTLSADTDIDFFLKQTLTQTQTFITFRSQTHTQTQTSKK